MTRQPRHCRRKPRWCQRCNDWVDWKREPVARPGMTIRRKLCSVCERPTTPNQPLPRTRTKKREPTEYQKLMDEAERLCRLIVMHRDGKRCQMDGCADPYFMVQWAHLISRGSHPIRCDPSNSVALCKRHHCLYTRQPGRAEEWRAWCISRIGAEEWNRLNRRRGTPWRADDWRMQIIALRVEAERRGLL